MLTNTDDAYGFPPFRYLAPAIKIGGQDYHQLRQSERDILASFLTNLRVRTLASDTFSWADDIPALIETADGRTPDDAGIPANGGRSGLAWAETWPRWDDGLAYGGAV